MKKILILASNPRKDLNLDREIRDLKGVVEMSRDREEFVVVTELAVRVGDLQDLLLRHEPQIVHFCGHGGGEEGLVFESDEVREQWLQTEALSNLFRLCAEHVECVLLNACYSEVQANAMIEHIDYVIGMRQTIQDNAAIAFSKGFYRALGYSKSIEKAYEFGCNAIQLEITGSSKVRSTATAVDRKLNAINTVASTVIPEHLKPTIKKSLRMASIAAPMISQAQQVEILLDIEASLAAAATPAQQYCDRVREFLVDRKLSALETIRLKRLRKDLGLSEGEAYQILAEEMEPIARSRDEYETMLIGLIEAGHYPFDPATQVELQETCRELGLSDEEVEAIAAPIFAAAEEEYQGKLQRQAQQEYEQKRQRYGQEFSRAIEAEYPIGNSVRDGLINFQQSLGLSDEDVARIEQPLVAPREVAYQQQQAQQRQLAAAEEQRRQAEQQQQQAQQRQRELADQQQEAARRKQEAAKHKPLLNTFAFQIATVQASPGLFRNKVSISDRPGQAEYFVEEVGNGVGLDMVRIPGGTFTMGSPSSEKWRSDDGGPQHGVTIPSFYFGKFAVTQAQWQAIAALPAVNRELDSDPSCFKGAQRPVEQVSWHEAIEFCDRLSAKTGKQYRLPSEAEWEYACRSGTTTPFSFGETITPELANYDGTAIYWAGTKGTYRAETSIVGTFPPNAFGLCDMHGNVWEWVADHYHEKYQGAPIDGSAWISGGNDGERLLRGGS